MYPVGTIVASSKNKEAIGYIFYPDKKLGKFKQIKDLAYYSITMLKMMRYISPKEFIFFIKSIHNNSSEWINEFVKSKFIHIDLIVVDSKHRNKGFAKSIIESVIKEADEKHLVTTLETQNPINVIIYKKFGFEVVKEQKYKELIQYCMIRQPNK